MKDKNLYLSRNFLLPVLLFTLIFISFWNVQHNDFIDSFDDDVYVTDNSHINTGIRLTNIKWALTATVAANWHPVTLISHMLDCEFFGLDARKHHLANLFLHLLNSLLLFVVLKQMTGRHWEPFIVAVFFGLHPMHVESVTWISERKDVLSTFFWMLTMWSYTCYASQPSIKRYLPVFFLYLLGIMSKPMVVTLPFVLLLLDYWPLNRFVDFKFPLNKKDIKTILFLISEKVPLFFLSGISSIITFRIQKYVGGSPSPETYSLFFRISNALLSYGKYIYKLFFPVNLSCLYPYPESIPGWQVILAAILLLTIIALVIYAGTKHKFLPVGWFWFLGTLVPVIGIVKVGNQAMADRYMYIPSIGLIIVIVWGVSTLLHKWRFKIPFFAVMFFVVAIVLGICTSIQVRHWSNTITLFEHAIAVDKNNVFAHNHLGVTMAKYGLKDETVRYTSAALKIKQNRPAQKRFEDDRLNQTYVKTYVILGKNLLKKDNIDPAIIHFKEALLADPDYSETKTELKKALDIRKEEIKDAKAIEKALQHDPTRDDLHLKLAHFYKRRGDLEMTESHLNKALSINPQNIDALMKLAYLNAIRGRYEKSVMFYKQAIRLKSDNSDAYYQIARIYARRYKLDESISWLRRAIENGYTDWNRLKKDKSLKTIHGTGYYKELMKNKPL